MRSTGLRLWRPTAALALTCAWLAAVPVLAQTQPSGRDIYLRNCSGCHQADGTGVPDNFPALIHDPVATGGPSLGARVVLEGAGPMPNFDAQLSDAQIAAVLSYVRTSFGNAAGPISPTVVAGVRKALSQGR